MHQISQWVDKVVIVERLGTWHTGNMDFNLFRNTHTMGREREGKEEKKKEKEGREGWREGERQKERNARTRGPISLVHFPNPHNTQRSDRPKPEAKNLLQISYRWQGPNYLSYHLLHLRASITRKLELQIQLGLNSRDSDMRSGYLKWYVKCSNFSFGIWILTGYQKMSHRAQYH